MQDRRRHYGGHARVCKDLLDALSVRAFAVVLTHAHVVRARWQVI